MKRILLISVATALCVGACGEKSNLALKARQRKEAAGAETANGKVTQNFVALENADNLKLTKNKKITRNVLLHDDPSKLSVLCTDNLELSLKDPTPLKLLGGGQVFIPQDSESEIPESTAKPDSKAIAAPKDMVNFICESPAAGTDNLENYENVKIESLIAGAPSKEVTGRFIDGRRHFQKIRISCDTDANLSKVEDRLFGNAQFPSKMVLSLNTYLLFETQSASQTDKKYILVKCTLPTADGENESKNEENDEAEKAL